MNRVLPPITWLGGKSKLAPKITAFFPSHHTYCEPFGGSAAVLLAKTPSKVEVYNDLDGGLVNFFRVLRDPATFKQLQTAVEATLYARDEFKLAKSVGDDPVEAARRLFVRQRQSHGGLGLRWSYCVEDSNSGMSSAVRRWRAGVERLPAVHRRLRSVQIEQDDWRRILDRYDGPRTLFYLDPPYVPETRIGGEYQHELVPDDHADLVARLLTLQGMSVLSGYEHPAYDPLKAAGWARVEYHVPAYTSDTRTRRVESLWISPAVAAAKEALTPKERMALGARQTHKARSEATEARVVRAIQELKRTGRRVTMTAVAEATGISREHLGRRYRTHFKS